MTSPITAGHIQPFLSVKNPFSLTVDPPDITKHPESKSVATGALTTFTVEATGDDLQFKWQKDGMNLSDDSKYHYTDTDTLHIVKVEKVDSKSCYRCHVKNEKGEKLSEQAVLTVSKLVVDACLTKSFNGS